MHRMLPLGPAQKNFRGKKIRIKIYEFVHMVKRKVHRFEDGHIKFLSGRKFVQIDVRGHAHLRVEAYPRISRLIDHTHLGSGRCPVPRVQRTSHPILIVRPLPKSAGISASITATLEIEREIQSSGEVLVAPSGTSSSVRRAW